MRDQAAELDWSGRAALAKPFDLDDLLATLVRLGVALGHGAPLSQDVPCVGCAMDGRRIKIASASRPDTHVAPRWWPLS